MSNIEKKFGKISDYGLELARLRTEELEAQSDDVCIEAYMRLHNRKNCRPSLEELQVRQLRAILDISRLASHAVEDSRRKLDLLEEWDVMLQDTREMLDEKAAHIERLKATLKAHGLDVDR